MLHCTVLKYMDQQVQYSASPEQAKLISWRLSSIYAVSVHYIYNATVSCKFFVSSSTIINYNEEEYKKGNKHGLHRDRLALGSTTWSGYIRNTCALTTSSL